MRFGTFGATCACAAAIKPNDRIAIEMTRLFQFAIEFVLLILILHALDHRLQLAGAAAGPSLCQYSIFWKVNETSSIGWPPLPLMVLTDDTIALVNCTL
jgi:hypothetical protein